MNVPNGWIQKPLGKIAKVTSGGTPSRTKPEYWGGDIPWLTTSVINFNMITEADEFITAEGLQNSSAKLFPKKTIVMAMYGQGMTRGRVAILGMKATTNQACAAILVNDSTNYSYLYYFLAGQYSRIRELGHGGNQKNLNGALIKAIPILLPPLPEQRRIAEVLSTWDEAITLTGRLIEAKQRRKEGLMQQLLTGKKRFREFVRSQETQHTKYGQIPIDWTVSPLGPFVNPISREELVIPEKEYQLIGVRWYVNGAHIHDILLGSEIVTNSLSRVQEHDILYNKMWVSKSAFAIAKSEHHGAYGTTEYPQFKAKSGLDVNFLEYVFHMPRFQYDATSLCRGTTGRIRLNPRDFLKIEIPLPSLLEQRRIAAVLQACDEEIELLEQKLAALQRQKQGLMQQLLTGKIRVGQTYGP